MLSIHGIACAVWDSGGTLGRPVWYISYPGEYTPGCPGSLQELPASQWPKIQPKVCRQTHRATRMTSSPELSISSMLIRISLQTTSGCPVLADRLPLKTIHLSPSNTTGKLSFQIHPNSTYILSLSFFKGLVKVLKDI